MWAARIGPHGLFKNKQNKPKGCGIGRGWGGGKRIWEELGGVEGDYDKNTVYEVFKELKTL